MNTVLSEETAALQAARTDCTVSLRQAGADCQRKAQLEADRQAHTRQRPALEQQVQEADRTAAAQSARVQALEQQVLATQKALPYPQRAQAQAALDLLEADRTALRAGMEQVEPYFSITCRKPAKLPSPFSASLNESWANCCSAANIIAEAFSIRGTATRYLYPKKPPTTMITTPKAVSSDRLFRMIKASTRPIADAMATSGSFSACGLFCTIIDSKIKIYILTKCKSNLF